jgi:glycerol kinase
MDIDENALTLCLDQGGHASRALVFDASGAVVAAAVHEVATRVDDDRVEQDPDEIVRSLVLAVRDVLARLGARAGDVRAAALATQRSSIVCWDKVTGRALSPVLSWQDRRAHSWLRQYEPRAAEIAQRTGLRLSAHYGASKLRWCLDNLAPVKFALANDRLAMGPLSSFLLFRLLDEHPLMVDPANAQRTLLWNLSQRDWDTVLLDLFGIPASALPHLTETRTGFGYLRVTDQPAIPLIVATGDQAAALFAFGAPSFGSVYVNMGTGAFMQRVTAAPSPIEGLIAGIAASVQGTSVYTLEGTVNGAGAALAWAAREFALPDLDRCLPEWLAQSEAGPLFLNGIGGLGAPYWVADFASRFIGEGDARQKVIAVAESIVFLLMANLERLRHAGTIDDLVVTGGLASIDGLCRRLADLSGVAVRRPSEHEATARGLAWLLRRTAPPREYMQETRFLPAPDVALHDRYRRWRVLMNPSQ